MPEGLEAAHIIRQTGDPISDQVRNRLLLRRDLHSLFDAFLWGMETKSGSFHLSDRLKSTHCPRHAGCKIHHTATTELLRFHCIQFRKHGDKHQREVSS